MKDNLTSELFEFCKKKQIDVIGICDPKLFEKYEIKNNPKSYLSSLKSVIVIGIHLKDIILDTWSQLDDREFQYIDQILINLCSKVKSFLVQKGYNVKILTYSPGIFLKEAAALSGIGPIGKNNLLITKEFGSQVRFRALVTNAELEYGVPIRKSKYCENCDKCIQACPSKALQNGKYHKDLCYNYCINNLKKLSKTSSVWCNVCIESCPVSKTAEF